MQPPDDTTLLRQYAETGADAPFAALVERHINLVYSVACRHVGNPHHAEQVTQAVFVILAKKASSLRHGRALPSWLFQTTRLTAGNFMRSEIRRHRREEEAHMQSQSDEPSGETQELWPHIAPLLDAAIAGLNDKDRQVIVLRYFENRSLADVGRELGANEDAARMRVNRALEKLRRFYANRGVNSTAMILAGAMSAHAVQAAPAGLAGAVTAVAAAKGAAAGASTLTLIKGALKIMAWTKAKTAVVVTVVTLAGLTATTVAVKHLRSPQAHPQPVARDGNAPDNLEAATRSQNNLMQIGLAFRLWGRHGGNQYPFAVSTAKGGTRELCHPDSNGYEPNPVPTFKAMANELSTPGILVVPNDPTKHAAASFAKLTADNISYLLRTGPNVSESNPEEILMVDPINGVALHCDGSVERDPKYINAGQ